MSYKVLLLQHGDWRDANTLRFSTREDAESYCESMAWNWNRSGVTDWRITDSGDDPTPASCRVALRKVDSSVRLFSLRKGSRYER